MISSRYKVNTNDLIRLNALNAPYSLYEGQSISIRGAWITPSLDLPKMAQHQRNLPPQSQQEKQVQPLPKTSLTSRSVSYSSASPDFTWPANGSIIEPFGTSARGVHNDGVNIAAPAGDAVRASQAGEVAFVGSGLKAFGNLVLVKHRGGWITAYAHLGDVTVKEGDFLDRGQVLGVVGQTGRVNSLSFILRSESRESL